jgi:hypothetical protein
MVTWISRSVPFSAVSRGSQAFSDGAYVMLESLNRCTRRFSVSFPVYVFLLGVAGVVGKEEESFIFGQNYDLYMWWVARTRSQSPLVASADSRPPLCFRMHASQKIDPTAPAELA